MGKSNGNGHGNGGANRALEQPLLDGAKPREGALTAVEHLIDVAVHGDAEDPTDPGHGFETRRARVLVLN